MFLFLPPSLASSIPVRASQAVGAHALRLGADFPCQVAQRFFIASEMRLRAAALIRRRFLPAVGTAVFALGGRPRRGGDDEVSPSSAEMAWSIRLRLDFET